ncbi:MAG: ATP-binding cassette domain-containing protein [Rhodobacterales bacterium]|nr:ATP-binding cassette domain-containing protein [Rhodobacterales bacterium]
MAILELERLSRHFEVRPGFVDRVVRRKPSSYIKAVEALNLTVGHNEILGIAGESGCGKSTTCTMVAGLLAPTGGDIRYKGDSVLDLKGAGLMEYRRRVQMIFQDPYESLNPRFRISEIVAEGPTALSLWDGDEIDERVNAMLNAVGLPHHKYADRYPHELSGGERQRVGIASALVMEPEMVIADEPLSMLDVSIRAGILDLFKDMQSQRHFSAIYVSHDLSILGNVADRLMVMYLGQAMEIGPALEVIRNPKHPYTRALIGAVPVPDPRTRRAIPNIRGDISKPIDPPPGCRFAPRCPHADASCGERFMELDTADPHLHQAACHKLDVINDG